MAEMTQAESILFSALTHIIRELDDGVGIDRLRMRAGAQQAMDRARAALPAHAEVAAITARAGHEFVKQ